jgi:hypothetical protein
MEGYATKKTRKLFNVVTLCKQLAQCASMQRRVVHNNCATKRLLHSSCYLGSDGRWMTAKLGTPRGRYDEHSSKSSLSRKPRFIEPVEERTNFRRLMLAGLASALDNLYMASYLGRSFAPAATWNLHITQPSTLPQLTVRLSISPVCCKQRIKRIVW